MSVQCTPIIDDIAKMRQFSERPNIYKLQLTCHKGWGGGYYYVFPGCETPPPTHPPTILPNVHSTISKVSSLEKERERKKKR